MNSNYNDFSILDILNIFSVWLQVMTLEQTTKQASTDDIMRELQRQDKEYMEKIIAQNNEILEKLADLQADILQGMPMWYALY